MNAREEKEVRVGAAWAVAVVATLGMSVSYVDRQTLAAIAPSVTKALDLTETQYGWLLSAFSMAYLVGAPTAGILVDRLGARRGFAFAVVIWSLVAGAHAFASSFASLFVLRILLGMAETPSFPAAAQAIRRALPGARRPLAFGLLFTGSSLGAIVAAKLGIRLEATFGFRGAFVGTALLGAMWLPAWWLVTGGRGLDVGTVPDRTQAAIGPSWWSVMTSGPVLRAFIAVVGSAPTMMFVLNWTAKYLVDGLGLPKSEISNYLVVPPLVFDLGAVGFGALASARETRTTGVRTHRGLLVVAMLMTASLALAPLTRSPLVTIVAFALAACGGAGIYALVTADMLARVPIERTSAAGGMMAAGQSLAHVLAAPLVGFTIDRTHGYATALVALGAIVIPTTLTFLAWPRIQEGAHAPSASARSA
jgi:ACS family hexuronate transporter-like MFS transporter